MIDAVQAALRSDRIGGSDAAAVCGVSPWSSAYDVWAIKTGRSPGRKMNEAMTAGRFFEAGLLDWLQEKLGVPLVRDQMHLHSDQMRVVNLDGLIIDGEPAIVEGKTAGLVWWKAAQEWQDEGDGAEAVPQQVLVQVHHAFGVWDERDPGIRTAHVVTFLGDGRGFRHYLIRRDDELVEAVAERVQQFYRDHILTDRPPDDSEPSLEVAKVMRRVPGKTVNVPEAVMREWLEAREAQSSANKRRKAADEALIRALGDAERGRSPAGCVTFLEYSRRECVTPAGTYRSLKLTKEPL